MSAGIYAIRNRVTGGFYIGSSVRIERRFEEHRCALNTGKHSNPHLMASYRKHGPDAFEYVVVALVPASEIHATEGRLLRSLVGRAGCYNIATHPKSGMSGRTASAETRAKLSASLRGHPVSARSIEALIKRNKQPKSAETRARHSEALRGRTLTPEHRAKVSAGLIGKRKGETRTAEQRAKISAARMGQRQSPDVVARRAATVRGRKYTPDRCARIRAGLLRCNAMKKGAPCLPA